MRDEFDAVPYQEAEGLWITPTLRQACAQAVHVITADGRILRGGQAVLFLLERTRWGWLIKWASFPPFVWLVEALYRIVAHNRNFFDKLLFPRAKRTGGCRVRRSS